MNEKTQLMQKLIRGISIFTVLVLFSGLIYFAVQIKVNHIHSEKMGEMPDSREETRLTPDNFVQVDSLTREFYFSDIQKHKSTNCLAFISVHQNVDVYADGNLIYQTMGGQLGFGKTTGTKWNFVDVPDGTKEMMVRFNAAYASGGKNNKKYKGEFFIGNGAYLYKTMVCQYLLSYELSMFIIFISVVLFLFWLFAKKVMSLDTTLAYYSMFTFFSGIWILCSTPLTSAFILSELVSFTTYMALMCMPLFFILFIRDFLEYKDNIFHIVLCGVHLTVLFICVGLMLAGVKDFKESVILNHLLLILDTIYVVFAIFNNIKNHRGKAFFAIRMLCTLVIVFAMFLNLIFYYLNLPSYNAWSSVCFIFVITIYSISLITKNVKTYNEKTKLAFYKEAAFHDYMTGLWNRNAFNEDLKNLPSLNDVSVVIFDLNYVKPVNDKFGHDMGDKYIIAAAHLIEGVFSAYGKCYRIGGDEFCCVIKKADKCNISSLIEQLRFKEKQFNMEDNSFKVQIACGHASYDELVDKTLQNTYSRADARMYDNKLKLKKEIV